MNATTQPGGHPDRCYLIRLSAFCTLRTTTAFGVTALRCIGQRHRKLTLGCIGAVYPALDATGSPAALDRRAMDATVSDTKDLRVPLIISFMLHMLTGPSQKFRMRHFLQRGTHRARLVHCTRPSEQLRRPSHCAIASCMAGVLQRAALADIRDPTYRSLLAWSCLVAGCNKHE